MKVGDMAVEEPVSAMSKAFEPKFEAMDKRFDSVERRLSGIDLRSG